MLLISIPYFLLISFSPARLDNTGKILVVLGGIILTVLVGMLSWKREIRTHAGRWSLLMYVLSTAAILLPGTHNMGYLLLYSSIFSVAAMGFPGIGIAVSANIIISLLLYLLLPRGSVGWQFVQEIGRIEYLRLMLNTNLLTLAIGIPLAAFARDHRQSQQESMRAEKKLRVELKGLKQKFKLLVRDRNELKTSHSLLEDERNDFARVNRLLLSQKEQNNFDSRARHLIEENFLSLFNSAIIGIGIMDLEGNIFNANRKMGELLGYPQARLRGEHYSIMIDKAYRQEMERRRNLLIKGVELQDNYRIECVRKDGEKFLAVIKGWIIYDREDRAEAMGFFLNDISKEEMLASEKNQLERQLFQNQKMEAIGTLASGIAHDFNNIISGIYGYTELAKDIVKSDPVGSAKFLKEVLKASDRAKDLVQQILRFSRQEKSEFQSLNITPVIKEAVKLLRSSLPSSISINLQIDESSDLIYADATQIHQVIMNLCTNAYHAMKAKGGSLSVHLENITVTEKLITRTRELEAGEYICLSIKDSGCGIAAENIDRIFEPYFTTKAKNEGTGLGLSVTLGIINAHMGGIILKSEIDKGSEFKLYFPLLAEKAGAGEASEKVMIPGNNELIYVVDDEPAVLDILEQYLNNSGYRTRAFQDPVQAFETISLEEESPSLLITDQDMPQMRGLDLAARVLATMEKAPGIVMTTGFSGDITEDNYREFGLSGFLLKPVNRLDLLAAVHEVINKSTEIT